MCHCNATLLFTKAVWLIIILKKQLSDSYGIALEPGSIDQIACIHSTHQCTYFTIFYMLQSAGSHHWNINFIGSPNYSSSLLLYKCLAYLRESSFEISRTNYLGQSLPYHQQPSISGFYSDSTVYVHLRGKISYKLIVIYTVLFIGIQ